VEEREESGQSARLGYRQELNEKSETSCRSFLRKKSILKLIKLVKTENWDSAIRFIRKEERGTEKTRNLLQKSGAMSGIDQKGVSPIFREEERDRKLNLDSVEGDRPLTRIRAGWRKKRNTIENGCLGIYAESGGETPVPTCPFPHGSEKKV